MDKLTAREWVEPLEAMLDGKLKKWKKYDRWEDGEIFQLHWQFELTHITMDIFWQNHQEMLILNYAGPRSDHNFMWHGLDKKTFNHVQDRIGNLVMATMHPVIDPESDT